MMLLIWPLMATDVELLTWPYAERIRIHVARSRHIILFELSRALYVVSVFGI